MELCYLVFLFQQRNVVHHWPWMNMGKAKSNPFNRLVGLENPLTCRLQNIESPLNRNHNPENLFEPNGCHVTKIKHGEDQ